MDGKTRQLVKRYGVALGLPVVALGLRSLLPYPEGAGIYQLPLAAIVLAAWYGGRGPGWLASAVSVVGAMYLLPPAGSFAVHPEHALPLSIFTALGLLLTEFSAGRRRIEQTLRESEARFRRLTELSAEGHWKQDENLRFIYSMDERHGFENRSLGKTRWELPFTPLSASWDEHRADLMARKPFHGFEYSRVRPDGTTRYISVSGAPAFDDQGAFKGYEGVASDITARKLAEAERRAHVWFLESMDRINRAMQGTSDLEKMMSDVLEAVLEIFASDRAWLLYPCDPDAPSWRVVMERTSPQFPGAAARGRNLPMVPEAAELARMALGTRDSLPAGPGHERQVQPAVGEHFGVRSEILMALCPQGDQAYLFGLHQCAEPRSWTKEEQRLFEEIGHRLSDALGSLTAYRSLRESERRLEAAQQVAHVGWWERDYAAGQVTLSDEACRIFGVQPVDLPHWHGRWLSLIHPDDRQKAAEASEKALRGEARYDVEYRVVRPDGTVRVVHSQGDVTRDDSGRAVRQFGVLQDITELRQAEDARRESEQRYRTLFEKANDAIFLENERDEIVEVNERACALLGYSREELLKMKVHDLQAPEVRGTAGAVLRREIEAHQSRTFEGLDLHRSGRRIPVEVTNTSITHRGETLVLSVVRDVTERKGAQDALRASEARFRTFVDHATDAFFLHDEKLAVVDVNRQGCESLGYSREELIGMHPGDFGTRLTEAAIVRISARAAAGERVTFETLHRRKDGMVFPVEVRARAFQQGDVRFHLSFARDISERKLAEETVRGKDAALQIARTELARVSRLTTLGELTASIAHEVNQPLGAMVTNAAACARWLGAKPPDMEEARAALANIVADGKRAGEVISRIRALTKRQMPRTEPLDVNRKVLEVLALVEHELKSHEIVLRTELAPALPRVAGDRVQLQQVLLNLIVNAMDAMSAVRNRPRELTIVSATSGADAVVVEVRDSGSGLDADGAGRVFEPFYTTKPQGLGIGLSISRSIVEAHGGRLWVNPNEPHGAIFRFTVPLAPEEQ